MRALPGPWRDITDIRFAILQSATLCKEALTSTSRSFICEIS